MFPQIAERFAGGVTIACMAAKAPQGLRACPRINRWGLGYVKAWGQPELPLVIHLDTFQLVLYVLKDQAHFHE